MASIACRAFSSSVTTDIMMVEFPANTKWRILLGPSSSPTIKVGDDAYDDSL